jgi:hypothetical protein
VWKFIAQILAENPELISQIVTAILKGIQKDPQASAQLLQGLLVKK